MNLWEKGKKVYGIAGALVLVILIISFLLGASNTAKHDNYNNETNAWICPGAPPDKQYSTGSISYEQVFFWIILVAAIMYIALMYHDTYEDFIPLKEAEKAVLDEVKRKQREGHPNYQFTDINFSTGSKLVWVDFPLIRIPRHWVIGFELKNGNKPTHWFKAYVHAKNGKVMGIVRTAGSFTEADTCSYCGTDYDMKVVSSPELKDLAMVEKIKQESGVVK
jgi:hypothetical protein